MKSVLISIQPKWCEKICHQIGEQNGKPVYEKRIEVRKSKPSEVPFKAYIYETKGATETPWADEDGHLIFKGRRQVIGEFVCDKVYNYFADDFVGADDDDGNIITEPREGEFAYWIFNREETCIPYNEILKYGKGKKLYGWHISDLVIYDNPKELSEFKTPPCEKSEKACGNCKWLVKTNTPDVYECECYVEDGRPITRAPQSWQYVEE